jgi:formylglycine-generating enzyme required for sulfatase activity
MTRFFISYSRVDEDFARRIATDLDRLGADVWIDVDDIPSGMNWSTAIQQGLDTCDVMLLILSPESMDSHNVRDEWQFFKDQGKPLIPLWWRPTKVHFQIHRLQYIDFHKQDYDTALRQLHTELRHKGIRLDPLDAAAQSVEIPRQEPLPAQSRRLPPRVWWAIGAVIALLAVGIAAILLSSGGNGDDSDPAALAETLVAQRDATQTATLWTPTPTVPTNTPTNTPKPPTATPTVPTATPEPPTPSPTIPTDTPQPPTATPTVPTNTPKPPAAMPDPTLELAQTPVASNADWTPVEREVDGVTMVLVPAGCFDMGSTDAQIDAAFEMCEAALGVGECERAWFEDESPVHRVCFDEPFWIDKYEVTNAQYRACVEAGACTLPGNTQDYEDPAYSDHPVVYVDWDQANDYAEWAGCSLPTEAQWEYAARGPDALVYPWGDEFDGTRLNFCDANCSYGWADPAYDDGYAQTAPVGSKPGGVSWVGALDLSGNVWEWVADWYDADYYATLDDGAVNPPGPADGSRRVLRGGAWRDDPDLVRAVSRYDDAPTSRDYGVGFRCVVRSPSQ